MWFNCLFLSWRYNRLIRQFELTQLCFVRCEALHHHTDVQQLIPQIKEAHKEFTTRREESIYQLFHYEKQIRRYKSWIASFMPRTLEHEKRIVLADNIEQLYTLIKLSRKSQALLLKMESLKNNQTINKNLKSRCLEKFKKKMLQRKTSGLVNSYRLFHEKRNNRHKGMKQNQPYIELKCHR